MLVQTIAIKGLLNVVFILLLKWFYNLSLSQRTLCFVLAYSHSKFGDIYDEEFFVKTLEHDVRVVNTIPDYIMGRFDYNMSNVYNFRIKAWSSINYYRDTVLPKLLEEKWVFGHFVLVYLHSSFICYNIAMPIWSGDLC